MNRTNQYKKLAIGLFWQAILIKNVAKSIDSPPLNNSVGISEVVEEYWRLGVMFKLSVNMNNPKNSFVLNHRYHTNSSILCLSYNQQIFIAACSQIMLIWFIA